MKKILFTLAILALCFKAHGQKVTALTEAATAGETSLLIVREGATGDLLKRITMAHLFTGRTLAGTTVLPSTTSIGNVSSAEILYLDGATSNLQAQLNDTAILNTGDLTDAVLIHVGDTTVTAMVGRIVFKTSDTHFYGCRRLTARKWYVLDN